MAGVDIMCNFRGTTDDRAAARRSSLKGNGPGTGAGGRAGGRGGTEGRGASRSNEVHVILDDIGSEFCLSICPYIGFERRPSEEFGDKGRNFKYKFGNARVYDRMNERTASGAAFPHVGKCMSAITSTALSPPPTRHEGANRRFVLFERQ